MKLSKFINNIRYKKDIQREADCIQRIKQAVFEKCGIDNCIEYDYSTVAFAGTKDNMELMLEILTQKDSERTFLYATVDDDDIFWQSWQEYDYNNLDEFEAEIVDYISKRVNQTVKTVIKKEQYKSYQEWVYVLDKNTDDWVLIQEEHTQDSLICRYFAEETETIEFVKTYKLQI